MTHSIKSEPKPRPSTITFEAIGTQWSVDIYDFVSSTDLHDLKKLIIARINEFDVVYSRFRDDSVVSQMANAAGTYALPRDARQLLDIYSELYDLTDGAMTPLIGQTLSDAGYDKNYSFVTKKVKPAAKWPEIAHYKDKEITLAEPALLDFGAAGKGYLVDIICDLLDEYGLRQFCVNASGDMVYRTNTADGLNVALEHPTDPMLAVGVATIQNQSICGSSGRLRAWSNFTHIIDGRTAVSPTHIASLWVVAKDALLSDALCTALYFVSPEKLQSTYLFEYAIIKEDFTVDHSPGFPAKFFTT